jgi:hypothetical protein
MTRSGTARGIVTHGRPAFKGWQYVRSAVDDGGIRVTRRGTGSPTRASYLPTGRS